MKQKSEKWLSSSKMSIKRSFLENNNPFFRDSGILCGIPSPCHNTLWHQCSLQECLDWQWKWVMCGAIFSSLWISGWVPKKQTETEFEWLACSHSSSIDKVQTTLWFPMPIDLCAVSTRPFEPPPTSTWFLFVLQKVLFLFGRNFSFVNKQTTLVALCAKKVWW